MARIGFIGLGNMGAPMVKNLLKAGHELAVFDVSKKAMDKVVPDGASPSSSAKQCAQGAEFVISMLPAGQHVYDLYLGKNKLMEIISEHKNALVIDCSTIEADVAQKVAKFAKGLKVGFVDCPVSGGVGGAVSGNLAFMVGGTKIDYNRVKPVLECMGKNIFYAGKSGAGQIAKACNNMLLGIVMAGTSEVLNMGMRNGMDPLVLSEIIKKSTGQNWAVEVYNPVPGIMKNVPSANSYKGGFQVDLMLKDLGLAMELCKNSLTPAPLGSQALSLYALHKNKGFGKLDFSSIFELYAENRTTK
ncbi:MAG: 3-hydroxyisobutyrate dehydrogenase [Proteobacteria bacterium]|nr:3-hydroxyisobutyrate dehydrogenase [Pseudomonadota bacterium]